MKDISFKSEAVYGPLGGVLMRVSIKDNGIETTKVVSMADYLSILGDNTYSNAKNRVRIGRLPEGFFDGCISSDNPSIFDVVLVLDGMKRPIAYGGRHWYVPFPKLLFYISVIDGAVHTKQCFSLVDEEVTADSRLYFYPFGNVDNTGGICMGNVRTERMENIQEANEFVSNFFFSETNDDYYSDKTVSGLSQAELLSRLRDKESYPNEWLVPFDGTVATILSKIKK